jgi:hypothetical protein
MWAVEYRHAFRLALKMAPVRVGLGDVAAEDECLTLGLYEYREMRGEGAIVGGRDQNREWVRVHKRNCVGMVTYSEVFGDVHVFLSPFQGS